MQPRSDVAGTREALAAIARQVAGVSSGEERAPVRDRHTVALLRFAGWVESLPDDDDPLLSNGWATTPQSGRRPEEALEAFARDDCGYDPATRFPELLAP